jgi:hypothetical protein
VERGGGVASEEVFIVVGDGKGGGFLALRGVVGVRLGGCCRAG